MSVAGRRPIGYEVTRTWCRVCAPEGVVEFSTPLREGEDLGVPYVCDDCGTVLAPCEHEWSSWRPYFSGGEFRLCDKDGCGEMERREQPAERAA